MYHYCKSRLKGITIQSLDKIKQFDQKPTNLIKNIINQNIINQNIINQNIINQNIINQNIINQNTTHISDNNNNLNNSDNNNDFSINKINSNKKNNSSGGRIGRIASKKKNQIRPHINPFSVRKIIKQPTWSEIYSNLQLPIHIDLGCGQGEMIRERSKWFQNVNMLGIDMRDIYIEIAKENQLANIDGGNHNNLHYISANINLNIKNLGLPKHLLKEISIFFPDPWFKRSHSNRRLVNQKLVQDLYDIAADDVTIYIQSDRDELALEIQKYFIDSKLFTQIEITESWDALFPKSRYQKFFQQTTRYKFKKIHHHEASNNYSID